MTTSHSKVLVIPRGDGLLVVVDGNSHVKRMSSRQYVQLAKKCIEASLEVDDEEEETENQPVGY